MQYTGCSAMIKCDNLIQPTRSQRDDSQVALESPVHPDNMTGYANLKYSVQPSTLVCQYTAKSVIMKYSFLG